MNKMDGKSKDLLKENIKQLKQLFPEVCCEDKIDFDKLKQILGEYVEDDKERYNFTWNRKGGSLRLSQTPSLGTLRPCKEESKDWDSTQNLYIEGDNLEVLKLLQKSYYGKVKMIYIAPPYNTGSDFVYKDDLWDSIDHYKEVTEQIDSEGNKQSTNQETNGRFHTDWLNMMYPRLRLARNLIDENGMIFISMDDHEFSNLKKLCDEIFGEQNHTATFTWTKTSTPPALSYKCRKTIEYVLVYEKRQNTIKYFGEYIDGGDAPLLNTGNPFKTLIFPPKSICFTYIDNAQINKGKTEKVDILNDIIIDNGFNVNQVQLRGEFKWEQSTLNKEIEKGTFFLVKSEKFSIRFQRMDNAEIYKTPLNNLNIELNKSNGVGTNETAAKDLDQLNLNKLFDFTKPYSLIKILIKMICIDEKEATILDFFSGSATTAHAVMQLNAEDGGDRRFIMVQLPEVCGEKTEAYKAGYKNICEIGKERIRRAGEKIKAEVEEENAQLKMGEEPKKIPDIGFRVFKLDSSNLKKWQPDYDDLEKTLLDSIENYVEGRSELDVVYEIILKMGLDLTYPVDELDLNGRKIYSVAFGVLMICLDDHITKEIVDGMISLYQEYQPELWKVVFKDNGFEDDSAKTNIKEQLKAAGLEEDAFTTI